MHPVNGYLIPKIFESPDQRVVGGNMEEDYELGGSRRYAKRIGE